MPIIACPVSSCEYKTEDVEANVAVALLTLHNHEHVAHTGKKQKPPKIDRPKIGKESSEETWNMFHTKWTMFMQSTDMSTEETVQQLFNCCEEDLGNDILRGHPDCISGTLEDLLDVIKKLAVIPVAVSVRRSELISTKQDHGEGIRSFVAKLKGKAATCAYTMKCSSTTCTQIINFTDIMVKDVMVAGLVDDDIRKDVLGWADLDDKSVNETINFIEAKEMARDALTKYLVNTAAGISSYKSKPKMGKTKSERKTCKDCNVAIDKYTWSRRASKMIECTRCLNCWKKFNKKDNGKGDRKPPHSEQGEVNTLIIGALDLETQKSTEDRDSIAAINTKKVNKGEVLLNHYIFDSEDGWLKSESNCHPTLRLHLTTDKSDYDHIGVKCPHIQPRFITTVSDTGAQSCLWSTQDFLRSGFDKSDLIPVKRVMMAANREQIKIDGAIFIRLSGRDREGNLHTAPVLVYVSPDTTRFYLSRDALVQLRVIHKNFPQVGAALQTAGLDSSKSDCGCLPRSLPPKKPDKLPFPCTPDNNEKMKKWLIERYSASTFNKCPHQQLPGMTGPEIRIHVDPSATPVAVQTPAMVPAHWYDEVKRGIDRDLALGVLERVPMGECPTWIHRMVVRAKEDGSCRRTIDLSPLNKFCMRETHHVRPPFQQVRTIPPRTWKTVTDAWNGYHSVPIRKEDRHLTTFITPWGLFRYRVAPQGFLASGDGYTRRFDEIISHFQQKTKCVDDTVYWDNDLTSHWWRTIEFLELCGRNGIVLNPEKFQFAQKDINFAGFHVTETEIKPHAKFLKAIKDFPTPTKLTDVRSWFGLVHQVANYGQLTQIMAPFKMLLSPKVKFMWNQELDQAFVQSKTRIVEAITKGVEIFDFTKPTCLRPDWSITGIGYFLSQKHCLCKSDVPDCCQDGWKVIMAGSRFLKPCEAHYAAVEGEALAIQWSLDQTKYFTLGCQKLLIVTDHKPLVKLFGDRTLDEISNPRLFRLKQKTLLWQFSIVHMPGKNNHGADAMSRHPVENDMESKESAEISVISNSEVLAGIRFALDSYQELSVAAVSDKILAVTWERVQEATSNDPNMCILRKMVQAMFPDDKVGMPPQLREFRLYRDDLYVIDESLLSRTSP